jgi:AraC family transcriptional regulator
MVLDGNEEPRLARGLPAGREVTLHEARVGGIVCSERLYPPGAELPPHAHANPIVAICLSGRVVEAVDGKHLSIVPGTVLVRPAGTLHSDSFDRSHLRAVMIEIESRARREALASLLGRVRLTHSTTLAGMGRRIAGELRLGGPEGPLAIEGLALEALARLAREVRTPPLAGPAWLQDALGQIRAHFLEDVRVSRIAGECGIHPAYFARVFRRTMGCTVAQYARRLRVEHAASLLGDSEVSLTEVALACGFADQAHLTRAFRAQVGTSPGAFRRLLGSSSRR